MKLRPWRGTASPTENIHSDFQLLNTVSASAGIPQENKQGKCMACHVKVGIPWSLFCSWYASVWEDLHHQANWTQPSSMCGETWEMETSNNPKTAYVFTFRVQSLVSGYSFICFMGVLRVIWHALCYVKICVATPFPSAHMVTKAWAATQIDHIFAQKSCHPFWEPLTVCLLKLSVPH